MLRSVFLAAGLALFVFLVVRLGPEAVLAMLGRIGWDAFLIAGIYAAYQAMRALALSCSVPGERRVTWREALWIRFSGEAVQFLTFTGPFLAEPAKAWLLKGRGLTAAEGFAATLTEYLVYTFGAAAFSIVALGMLLGDGVVRGTPKGVAIGLLIGMSVFLAVAAVAIATRTHLLGAILERLARLPGIRLRLRPDMAGVHHVEDLLLGVLHDRPALFARVALAECGALALHMAELYAILHALDLEAGLRTAFLIEGSTKFIGLAFFFVPGQVGASEGAHTIVFQIVGLPAVAGFTIPFLRRIRSIVVAGVGLFGMSLLTREPRSGMRNEE